MQRDQRDKIAVLEAVAEAWNQAAISYAVAHGLERYPETVGRDLDVLVRADQVREAITIARQVLQMRGWTVVFPPALWGERLVAVQNRAWDKVIEVHTMRRLSWRGALLVDRPQATGEIGPFRVDAWASFVKRVLMPVLVGQTSRFQDKPDELRLKGEEMVVVPARLPEVCGSLLARSVLNAVEASDLSELERLRAPLRRAITWRSLKKNPLLFVRLSILTLWKRVLQPFAPCAPIVALVGPDGVGKSTVLRFLGRGRSVFTQIVHRHWRPALLPRLGALVGKSSAAPQEVAFPPRREPGRFHYLRLLYHFLDFVLGYYLKDRVDSSRQRLVLYDRTALDMTVDPVRYGLSSARGTRLFWRLIPKPDLVILLWDHPERIYARKPELPKEEIKRQLEKWLELAREGEIGAIVNVDAPPEEIARRLQELIIEIFIQKNGGSVPEEHHRDPLRWLNSVLGVGSQGSGHRSELKYGYVRLRDGRGYLIPLHPPRVAAKALEIYPAQSRKARLAKTLLSAGLRTGVAQFLLPKVRLANEEAPDACLLEYVKLVFGRHDLRFAISLGAPGPHRKPVIQVFTSKGHVLGYVKVGRDETTNALVRNEVETLEALKQLSLPFEIPSVIFAGEWQGRFLCVQAVPGAKVGSAPQSLSPEYLEALRGLAEVGGSQQSLAESTLWIEIQKKAQKVQNAHFRHVLEQGMQAVGKRLNNQSIWFHRCHGDFSPWNAYCMSKRLYLYDWEYSREAPAGYDLFHFLVQTQLLLKRLIPSEVCRNVLNQMRDSLVQTYWSYLNVEQDAVYPLFLLYLLERLAFHSSEKPESFWILRDLAMMININLVT